MVIPWDADKEQLEAAKRFSDSGSFLSVQGRAEGGDADAQYRMGVWYLDGNNSLVKPDKETAAGWFAKAADQGNDKAKNVLQQMSLYKDGELEHLRCYVCLAGAERYSCFIDCDRTAETRRIQEEEQRQDREQLLKEAEQGTAEAQLQAGYGYETGIRGLQQDYAKAFEWYSKSAEQGNEQAQNRLGFYYAHGKGVKKNFVKAAEWYEKAALQGSADAQWRLGKCFDEGNGVAQDKAKAAEWYRKAAEQGDVAAKYDLEKLMNNNA